MKVAAEGVAVDAAAGGTNLARVKAKVEIHLAAKAVLVVARAVKGVAVDSGVGAEDLVAGARAAGHAIEPR